MNASEFRQAIIEWLAENGYENQPYEAKARMLGLSIGTCYNLLSGQEKVPAIALDKVFQILEMIGYNVSRAASSQEIHVLSKRDKRVERGIGLPILGTLNIDDTISPVKTRRKLPLLTQDDAEIQFKTTGAWQHTSGPCRFLVVESPWRDFTQGTSLVCREAVKKEAIPIGHYAVITITELESQKVTGEKSERRWHDKLSKARTRRQQYLVWCHDFVRHQGTHYVIVDGNESIRKWSLKEITVDQIVVGGILRNATIKVKAPLG